MFGLLNSSRSIWVGLIIAISLGLAIEFLKSTKSSVSASAGSSRLFGVDPDLDANAFADSAELENRERAGRARSRLLKGRLSDETRVRISGLTKVSAVAAEPANESAAVKPAPVTTLAKPAIADSKIDTKKKKKKKKKKETKNEDIAAVSNPPTTASTSDDKKKSSSDDVIGGSSFSGGGTSRRQTTVRLGAVVEDPETLEEWLKFILREPNYERTLKLIEAQQQRLIDSEIFHEVISQMLADSRPKMHEFAVYALGSSPSLKSFLLLETANRSEPEGSALRLQTRSHMKAYAKLENLRILASVISAQVESAVSFEALRLIQVAVTAYRSQSSSGGGSGTGSGGSGPSTSAVASNITRHFTPFVSVLTRFAQIATDQSLQQEATQTLNQVRSIVGSTAGASPSTPPSGGPGSVPTTPASVTSVGFSKVRGG